MSSNIYSLGIASALFIASHLGMSMSAVRTPLIGRLGPLGFKVLYSLVSLWIFTWMVNAYMQAPRIELFSPSMANQHWSLTMMLLAAFMVVAGFTTASPTAMGGEEKGFSTGPRGIVKITRHPVMWGFALFGIAHVVANGHLAALLFFGALVGLALSGAWHIDARRRAVHGEAWADFEAETSFVPLVAIATGRTRVEKGEIKWWQSLLAVGLYIGMLAAHAQAGRDVFPMGFF